MSIKDKLAKKIPALAKIDNKKIATFIIFAAVTFLYINNNLFMPMSKKNKELAAELKARKGRFESIQMIYNNSVMLAEIKKKIELADSFFSETMPPERLVPELNELLAQGAKDAGISVNSMVLGNIVQNKRPVPGGNLSISYEALPITMVVKSNMAGLIKYLAWLKAQKRYIRVERASLIPDEQASGLVITNLILNAYTLPKKGLSPAETKEDITLDKAYLEKTLTLPQEEKIDLSAYTIGEPFVYAQKKIELAGPTRKIPLALSGIVLKAEKGGSKALINGKFVKEGSTIKDTNIRVIKIEGKRVILEEEGREFALEMKKKQG